MKVKISHRQLSSLFGEAVTKELAAANEDVCEAISEAAETMILSTPVDTSKAISNWQAARGENPNLEVIPPYFPGLGGDTAAASGSVAVENVKDIVYAKDPGEAVTIANNVDYIQDLDARVSFETIFRTALDAELFDKGRGKSSKNIIILGE